MKFISPLLIILAVLVAVAAICVVAFTHYPVAAAFILLIAALLIKALVKREHLTFFYNEYDADILPTQIEASESEIEP